MSRRTLLAACLLGALAAGSAGCAWRDRAHTPLFNASEKYLVPKTQPARALSFPVTVPVSLAAVTLDMLLVHPVMELPKAYDDTKDLFWDLHWRDWQGEAFTMGATLAPRVALTPVVFAGDWLGRSIVGSGGSYRRPQPPADGPRQAAEARLRDLLSRGDRAGFLAAADNLCRVHPDLHDCRKAEAMRALDARQFDRLAEGRISWGELERGADELPKLAAAIREGDGAQRAAVMNYMAGWHFPKATLSNSPALLDAVGGLTVGADRALALQAVQLLAQCPKTEGVTAVLSGVAAGGDPVLAYHANKALKGARR